MTATESIPMPRKRKPKVKTVGLMLRLPPDLHRRLIESSDSHEEPKSLNAEIVRLLKVALLQDIAERPTLTDSEREELNALFLGWWRKKRGELE
jgi:hypothetical protein